MRDPFDVQVNVGMGVDGTSSNDSGSLLAETRLAMFLQRGGNKRLDSESSIPLEVLMVSQLILSRWIRPLNVSSAWNCQRYNL